MISEAERFNVLHPDLCPCLRWKGMFIQVEHDPSVPPAADNNYWCVYTQTCIGPDGRLAEPIECISSERACYGTGAV